MNICASLQFNSDNYLNLTTGYSRNLLLTMSLVDCLNSGHELVGMFIFVDTIKTSSDVDHWLEYIVNAWLPKLFRDAQFTKLAVFSFNDSDPERGSGAMVFDGKEIPIRFIYHDDLTIEIKKIEAMASYIQETGADLILATTSNFSFLNWIGNDLNETFIKLGIKLKILLVEGVNASVYKALPVSSISDMQIIWKQLENDRETYAAYSVGINDIFIKVLQITCDNLAFIEDLTTNNSFFELINTSPLEITSSGNNIKSSSSQIIPALNGKIDKIKYLRTFATSLKLKNKGDKIIIKLNSIKVDRQITKDSLNESIVKNFNKKSASSLPKCEAVYRSVNAKEANKLYFILTDTICEELQPIQTDNKTIYEYNLRLVFEIDSIMKYMSKLVLLIVNNLSKYLPSK